MINVGKTLTFHQTALCKNKKSCDVYNIVKKINTFRVF